MYAGRVRFWLRCFLLLVVSCFMWSGALESPYLLLSYSVILLASRIAIILTSTIQPFPSLQIWFSIAALLEIFDFPPLWGLLDAHALWHVCTVPLPSIWYAFIQEDARESLEGGGGGEVERAAAGEGEEIKKKK